MPMKYEYFRSYLNKRLDPDDVYLPVDESTTADLKALLPEGAGDYMYLAIKSDSAYEVVKLTNESGTLVLERGLGGTTPVLHHYGACIYGATPLDVLVMQALIAGE